jgi:phage anti-repressor protein
MRADHRPGHGAHSGLLVNARDLYKHLGFRQAYAGWFDDRGQRNGYRNGLHYARVFVKLRQYDHYLTLDAADSLLCQESHPRAIEARAYLREVAREQQGRVIEGEAVRVEEKPGLPALPTFPDDGLVTVTPGTIGGKPCMVVDGLELHDRLGSRRDFSTWIKGRIAKYGFAADEDYETSQVIDSSCSPKRGSRESNLIAGANRITYTLTLEMAKELAMVENNAMGRKIRRYFINCERLVLDFYRDAASRVAAPVPVAPTVHPADTPPHAPLIIQNAKRDWQLLFRRAFMGKYTQYADLGDGKPVRRPDPGAGGVTGLWPKRGISGRVPAAAGRHPGTPIPGRRRVRVHRLLGVRAPDHGALDCRVARRRASPGGFRRHPVSALMDKANPGHGAQAGKTI